MRAPGRSIVSCAAQFLFALFIGALSLGCAAAQQSSSPFNVGVIQYNVKNSEGGWVAYSLPSVLDTQVEMIAARITADVNNGSPGNPTLDNAPVDFITLVNGDLGGKFWNENIYTFANISDLLEDQAKKQGSKFKGLTGWKTIASFCHADGTQLAYSPDWSLVTDPTIVSNPLVNASSPNDPQYGWGWDTRQDECGGRPYNIAYFKHKSGVKLIFVIAHMPHCYSAIANCLTQPDMNDYQNLKSGIADAVEAGADLTKIKFVMAGDLNEYGQSNTAATFQLIFPYLGSMKLSPALNSCCQNDGFSDQFDRVVAAGAASVDAKLLDPPKPYPFDPNFDTRLQAACATYCKQHSCNDPKSLPRICKVKNEEHKAIFGLMQFQ